MNANASSPPPDRDLRFDILKTVGIFCIILAHTNADDVIDQIRNFDVPLMVMVSGALFSVSRGDRPFSFGEYFRKRVVRLIAPVWIFLVLFFSATYVLDTVLMGKEYPYSWQTIGESFITIGELDGLWIVRVFILIASISPAIVAIVDRAKTTERAIVVLLVIYGIYEVIFSLSDKFEPDFANDAIENFAKEFNDIVINDFILYAIPYGCIFGMGILWRRANRKTMAVISATGFVVFIALGLQYSDVADRFIKTQAYKYPPQLYYFAYAIFASMLLYLWVDRLVKTRFWKTRSHWLAPAIVFISSSTLWIYLWQMFWLEYEPLLRDWLNIGFSQPFTFFTVSLLSIACTLGHKTIVQHFVDTTQFGRQHQKLMSVLFLK